MATRWTTLEENRKRAELKLLYLDENKTIKEVGTILGIADTSVYDRLKRLNIQTIPQKKLHYLNRRLDIHIPTRYSKELAEFTGILMGDGHLSSTQVWVSSGSDETQYQRYIRHLSKKLFNVFPRRISRKNRNAIDLYIGSTALVRFFLDMGLVSNKVKEQVKPPWWIWDNTTYIKNFLRGIIDTDGSIYKLRFGTQINFCNRSSPLLHAAREMLIQLGFHPSQPSHYKIYLTRRDDLRRYMQEIGFSNPKHFQKAKKFGTV